MENLQMETMVSDKLSLFIHLGVHRTATTTIQSTMLKNWEYLKNKDIFYPRYAGRHSNIFSPIFWGKVGVEQVANKLLALASSHSSSIHTILISDENISMWRDLSFLKPFTQFFNVKIIFCMRRQDLWLESWWPLNVMCQENQKFSHASFPDFLAGREQFHWINYDRCLQHLEELFGIENIQTYVFEKSQMPDGAVATFFRQIDLNDYSTMIPPESPRSNASFLPEISEFFRHLPLDEAKQTVRYDLLTRAMQPIDEKLRLENPVTLMIPYDERITILQEYEAGNKAVAQRYFSRDQLFFEPLPTPDSEVAAPALPVNSEELMTRLVIPYFRELITQLNAQ